MSHSEPSTPTSYQRPPAFGSITKSFMSVAPMWYSAGHQVISLAVNTSNARC